MRLAPGEFARSDVLRFGKIGRAGVLRCVQITGLNSDPVRYAIMHVASVVVRGGLPVSISPAGKISRKRIDPGTRADPVLSPFKLAEYGSEQPGQRWLPMVQPPVLQPKTQKSFSNAKNVCFIQE